MRALLPTSVRPTTHRRLRTAATARAGELAEQVSAALRGTSVYVVGDSSDANARLADALAAQLGYAPLHTCRLLAALEASAADGVEAGAQNAGEAVAEAMLLEELSTVVRCCVATLGGGRGAAARGDCWRHLFGGVTVFLEVRVVLCSLCLADAAFGRTTPPRGARSGRRTLRRRCWWRLHRWLSLPASTSQSGQCLLCCSCCRRTRSWLAKSRSTCAWARGVTGLTWRSLAASSLPCMVLCDRKRTKGVLACSGGMSIRQSSSLLPSTTLFFTVSRRVP